MPPSAPPPVSAVEFRCTVAGTIETFNATAFTLRMAAFLGVAPELVTVVATSASVQVDVTVTLPDPTTAATAAHTVETSTASELTTALDVSVLQVTAPRVLQLTPPSPPPSVPPSPPAETVDKKVIIAAAAGGGGLLLVSALIYCFIRSRGGSSGRPLITKHPTNDPYSQSAQYAKSDGRPETFMPTYSKKAAAMSERQLANTPRGQTYQSSCI